MAAINTADLEAAVTEAEQGEASVEVFIQGIADKIKTAVTAAVTEAVTADQAANQATVDAANLAVSTAIDAVTVRLKANSAKLATAIAA